MTGYVVGEADYYAGDGSAAILKTTDGGHTWVSVRHHTGADQLSSVHFLDETTGWAAAWQGGVLKTTDGGATWSAAFAGGYGVSSVYFSSAETGWVTTDQGIALSTDGGASWGPVTEGLGRFDSLHFADAETGVAVGPWGVVARTTDGGASWSTGQPAVRRTLVDAHFADDVTGWAVGDFGTIAKTENGGASWTALPSGVNADLKSVYFADAQTGWVVGRSGVIRKTVNGGASWSVQASGTFDSLNAVHFADNTTGWIVGERGTVLRTQNGGVSWTRTTVGTSDLNAVHFTDASNGWAVGRSGAVLRTTDGGASWTSRPANTTADLTAVHFHDADNGIVVGRGANIRRTEDGGASWTTHYPGASVWLEDVSFISPDIGWVVGTGGTISATTDGGRTWQLESCPTDNALHGVHLTPTGRGWAVGAGGTVLGIETAHSAPVDELAPTTSISGLPEGWTREDVTFVLHAEDDGSGVAHTYYRLGEGAPMVYSAPVTVSAEGTTTITYWSVDEAGNLEEPNHAAVCIDKTPPVVLSDVQPSYVGTATITVTVSDSLSGVASAVLELNEEPVGGLTIIVSEPGDHTLAYRVTDSAGNVTEGSLEFSVRETASETVTLPGTGISLSFASLISAGEHSAVRLEPSLPAPANFRVLRESYYDISTTAAFEGLVSITIPYDPAAVTGANYANLKLFHWKDGGWRDITTSVDTVAHTVTGQTDSFSPFAIMEPSMGTEDPPVTPGDPPVAPVPASSWWSLLVLAMIGGWLSSRRDNRREA